MIVGIDGGYSAFKAKNGQQAIYLPSAVGTVNKARFSLNTHTDIILDAGAGQKMVGEVAIRQSRFLSRKEDRNWITGDEYKYLMAATFSEMSTASLVNLQIVTGLPVAFYDRDRQTLQDQFLGEHRVLREGRTTQVFRVQDCRVIPQPFGTIFTMAIDEKGRILDNEYSTGNIGVIDIGGKTTNLLSVNRLEEISDNTASVNQGAWDAVRAFRAIAETEYPGLEDLKDHEVTQAIIDRKQQYYNKTIDLSSVVDSILDPMAEAIISQAGNLWNSGALLNSILITGGGALLLGHYIKKNFPHAVVVDDPIYANAKGYYKFGLFVSRQS
jgi:plasmid segregation protein ParM